MCACVFFYLLIHKDFGLSFSTESQEGRGASSLNSNGYRVQFFCGLHRSLAVENCSTAASQAQVVFSPSLDMEPPIFSILALAVLYLIHVDASLIPAFQD